MALSVNTVSQTLSREQNPVLQREFEHQRYVIQTSRSGYFWIFLAVLMVVPALVASVVYLWSAFFGLFEPVFFYDFATSNHAFVWVLLMLVNLSLYPVVTLVTMSLSANSIRREKIGHTWGILRLTDVAPEQIMFGKWWASLRALNGDHAMVLLVRLGLVAFHMSMLYPSYLALDNIAVPYKLHLLLLIPLVLLQGAFDAMLTAALGIIATVLDDAPGAVAGSSAMLVRILLTIVTGVWLAQVLLAFNGSPARAFIIAIVGVVAYGMFWITSMVIGYSIIKRAG